MISIEAGVWAAAGAAALFDSEPQYHSMYAELLPRFTWSRNTVKFMQSRFLFSLGAAVP
jgi:hypothetical protein